MDEDRGSTSESQAVLVVLHERSGEWGRRLRTRIADGAVRWIETRSTTDLLAAVAGSNSPVVLIEVGPDPERGLRDVAEVASRDSSPLILVLDPEDRAEVRELAEEIGAVYEASGRLTPPEVAGWLSRWIELAAARVAREGWTRTPPADPIRDPVAWILEQEADRAQAGPTLES